MKVEPHEANEATDWKTNKRVIKRDGASREKEKQKNPKPQRTEAFSRTLTENWACRGGRQTATYSYYKNPKRKLNLVRKAKRKRPQQKIGRFIRFWTVCAWDDTGRENVGLETEPQIIGMHESQEHGIKIEYL